MTSDTEAKPVAWRWRSVESVDHWIYDPSTAWMFEHANDPAIVFEPLFTNPSSIRNAALDEAAKAVQESGKVHGQYAYAIAAILALKDQQ